MQSQEPVSQVVYHPITCKAVRPVLGLNALAYRGIQVRFLPIICYFIITIIIFFEMTLLDEENLSLKPQKVFPGTVVWQVSLKEQELMVLIRTGEFPHQCGSAVHEATVAGAVCAPPAVWSQL